MSQAILDALRKFDVNNDSQWTVEGQPKLDVLKDLSGDATVTREALDAVAPGFNRDSYRAYLAQNPQVVNAPTTGTAAGVGGGGVAAVASEAPAQPATGAEPGPSDREAAVEALAEEIRGKDEAILELQRLQDETGKKLSELNKERDALSARLEKYQPAHNHTVTAQAYLERQKENLRLRGEAIAAVRATGVDLKALAKITGKSPIDQRLRAQRRHPTHLAPATNR